MVQYVEEVAFGCPVQCIEGAGLLGVYSIACGGAELWGMSSIVCRGAKVWVYLRQCIEGPRCGVSML